MVSRPECQQPAPSPDLLILSLSKDEDALRCSQARSKADARRILSLRPGHLAFRRRADKRHRLQLHRLRPVWRAVGLGFRRGAQAQCRSGPRLCLRRAQHRLSFLRTMRLHRLLAGDPSARRRPPPHRRQSAACGAGPGGGYRDAPFQRTGMEGNTPRRPPRRGYVVLEIAPVLIELLPEPARTALWSPVM